MKNTEIVEKQKNIEENQNDLVPQQPITNIQRKSSTISTGDDSDELEINSNIIKNPQIIKLTCHINHIISNINISEDSLQNYCKDLNEDDKVTYNLLVDKFKNLKKTKEEQIKFCMRKAFKFVFNFLKEHVDLKNYKEANELCMKTYFQSLIGDKKFVLPFRRNSELKTMNSSFLKKVFSSAKFTQDYQKFLKEFDELSNEDNSKKVDLLAQSVYQYQINNDQQKINKLRRLPWTQELLNSTKILAFSLLQYADQTKTSIETNYKEKIQEQQLFLRNQQLIQSQKLTQLQLLQLQSPQSKIQDFYSSQSQSSNTEECIPNKQFTLHSSSSETKC